MAMFAPELKEHAFCQVLAWGLSPVAGSLQAADSEVTRPQVDELM